MATNEVVERAVAGDRAVVQWLELALEHYEGIMITRDDKGVYRVECIPQIVTAENPEPWDGMTFTAYSGIGPALLDAIQWDRHVLLLDE